MKYRQIATSIWEDDYVLGLTDKELKAFIYFFTNHKVNMVGIYELPDIIIRYTLGATLDEIKQIKKKFEADRKYFFYKNWVYINNFHKHNSFSSASSVINTYLKDFNSIPQEVLKHFLIDLKLNYIPTIVKKDKVSKLNTVMVKVMVMDKKGSPYPRIEAISLNEDVDPDDIPM
jgi:hypothetical protein